MINGLEKKGVNNCFLSILLSDEFYIHNENEHQLIFGKTVRLAIVRNAEEMEIEVERVQ